MSTYTNSPTNLSQKLQPFVSGGISAMLASSVVHPMDLAKVRLQLFSTQFPNEPKPFFTKILSNIIKNEGFFGIYAGISASLLRQAVYGTARIGLHKTFSEELKKRNDNKPLPFYVKTLSGMLSGSIAVCIATPIDVSLVRMQADTMKPPEKRRNYNNVLNAMSRILREEGFFKLYSGIFISTLRGMAINVGTLACFDQAAEMTAEYIVKEPKFNTDGTRRTEFTLKTQLIAALCAGFCSTTLSLPFDIIKSRLQYSSQFSGVTHVIKYILKNEGILAFWTGYIPYYFRSAPHSMIILLTLQPVTKFYKEYFKC